jgi:hypothetical protein
MKRLSTRYPSSNQPCRAILPMAKVPVSIYSAASIIFRCSQRRSKVILKPQPVYPPFLLPASRRPDLKSLEMWPNAKLFVFPRTIQHLLPLVVSHSSAHRLTHPSPPRYLLPGRDSGQSQLQTKRMSLNNLSMQELKGNGQPIHCQPTLSRSIWARNTTHGSRLIKITPCPTLRAYPSSLNLSKSNTLTLSRYGSNVFLCCSFIPWPFAEIY